jgi:class 3 adenylate cyclase
MRCSQCGFENRETVRFCEECSAKLELRCSACGTTVPLGRKFCGGCGQPLSTADAPAPRFAAPDAYTPRHLAEKILTSKAALEGERKQVTVLFADVVGFSTLSERLDPEIVHTIMDGCFELLTRAVHRYEGTINQFTGDGIMALFGAPITHEDQRDPSAPGRPGDPDGPGRVRRRGPAALRAALPDADRHQHGDGRRGPDRR